MNYTYEGAIIILLNKALEHLIDKGGDEDRFEAIEKIRAAILLLE
jgi:hypothetical protein